MGAVLKFLVVQQPLKQRVFWMILSQVGQEQGKSHEAHALPDCPGGIQLSLSSEKKKAPTDPNGPQDDPGSGSQRIPKPYHMVTFFWQGGRVLASLAPINLKCKCCVTR